MIVTFYFTLHFNYHDVKIFVIVFRKKLNYYTTQYESVTIRTNYKLLLFVNGMPYNSL